MSRKSSRNFKKVSYKEAGLLKARKNTKTVAIESFHGGNVETLIKSHLNNGYVATMDPEAECMIEASKISYENGEWWMLGTMMKSNGDQTIRWMRIKEMCYETYVTVLSKTFDNEQKRSLAWKLYAKMKQRGESQLPSDYLKYEVNDRVLFKTKSYQGDLDDKIQQAKIIKLRKHHLVGDLSYEYEIKTSDAKIIKCCEFEIRPFNFTCSSYDNFDVSYAESIKYELERAQVSNFFFIFFFFFFFHFWMFFCFFFG